MNLGILVQSYLRITKTMNELEHLLSRIRGVA